MKIIKYNYNILILKDAEDENIKKISIRFIIDEDTACLLLAYANSLNLKVEIYEPLDHELTFITYEDNINSCHSNIFESIEKLYTKLIENGMRSRDAKKLLPRCVKNELIITGHLHEWQQLLYFYLRDYGNLIILELNNELHKMFPKSFRKDVGIGEDN